MKQARNELPTRLEAGGVCFQGRDWGDCLSLAGDEGRRGGEHRLRRSCLHYLEALRPEPVDATD